MALKVVCKLEESPDTVFLEADVNGDGKIGLPEAIYDMQDLALLRVSLTGTWHTYYTETGGVEQGPELWGVKQTGNSLLVCGADRVMTGTRSGAGVSIDMCEIVSGLDL